MPQARIIDGKAAAARLRGRIGEAVADARARHGLHPGLAVVLVGDNGASQVYVRNKTKLTEEVGMVSFEHILAGDTSQGALLDLIAELNAQPAVHGILVQLPLPGHIDAGAVIDAIDPSKDVDGFHAINAGRLMTGTGAGFVPCTPLGCMVLIREHRSELAGLDAIVIGRSNIVGKPIAHLLLGADCTVTIAHSRSGDLAARCRAADVLVAAVGRPEMVRGSWIKPGATVIDVGINRVEATAGKPRLLGDVAFAEAAEVAGAITPVPGGVGPMTIASLLMNTLTAAHRSAGLAPPNLGETLSNG